MGLFNKKKEDEDIPKLPELPELPDLPESLAERPGRLEMELNLARGSVGYGFRFQRFKEGDQGQFIRSEDPRNGISPKDVLSFQIQPKAS